MEKVNRMKAAWYYVKKNFPILAIISLSAACGIVLFLLQGGEDVDVSSAKEGSFLLPLIVILFIAGTIGLWVYKTKKTNKKEGAKKTTLGIKTEWIDNARGPLGVLLLYSCIVGLSHIICWVAWPQVWGDWMNQAGLFWTFNLFLVGAIFWGFQRFAGAKWVSAVFIVLMVMSLLSALPKQEETSALASYKASENHAQWVYTWTIAEGVSRSGYNSKTHDVIVNELTGSLMDFTLLYRHNGKDQECHFRWDKSKGNRGTWFQDEPHSEGTFILNKVSDSLYTGTSYGEGPAGESMMFIELRKVR